MLSVPSALRFSSREPSCQAATSKPDVVKIEEQPSYDRDPGETSDRSRRISGIRKAVHSVSVGTRLAIWKVLCLWADQAFISISSKMFVRST